MKASSLIFLLLRVSETAFLTSRSIRRIISCTPARPYWIAGGTGFRNDQASSDRVSKRRQSQSMMMIDNRESFNADLEGKKNDKNSFKNEMEQFKAELAVKREKLNNVKKDIEQIDKLIMEVRDALRHVTRRFVKGKYLSYIQFYEKEKALFMDEKKRLSEDIKKTLDKMKQN